MQMSENKMIVADALSRIDFVLDTEPVPVSDEPQHPKDGSVKLSDVHFSYDGETDVIKGVSMDIKSGQTVALVGPSGGGKTTLQASCAGSSTCRAAAFPSAARMYARCPRRS